ncbi:TOM1-like protein 2 [Styela clava]
MDRVQSMFSNAFTTKAGQLIEKATAATLTSEDWTLNMEICDVVNSYEEGPKDAMKAIKRRLTNNKNPSQINYTLTVLETCVKNCGSRFHIHVTSKDFCNEVLIKVIHSKNTPSLMLQHKILGMIQEWAETFKNTAAMRGVVEVYEELKEKGWEFPQQDKTAAAPILTPKRSVPQPAQQPQVVYGGVPGTIPIPGQQPQRLPPGARPSTGPITPSQEQITKLRSELQIVLGNIQVFSEMLTELVPGQTEPADLELLQELNRTCRAMHQRVVELIERVANEELTAELLKVNDDLNNVFLRYERFEKYRTSQSTAPKQEHTPSPVPTSMAPPSVTPYPLPHSEPPPSYSDTEQTTPEVSDLIDLGAEDAATLGAAAASQPPQPSVTSTTSNMAAMNLDQLMMTPTQPASYPSLSQDLAQFDNMAASAHPPTGNAEPSIAEMTRAEDEIEKWLEAGEVKTAGQSQTIEPANGVEATTDEFNAFLTERVSAGDQLPTLPDVPTGAVGGQTNNTDGRQRKMQSGNQPMFGL